MSKKALSIILLILVSLYIIPGTSAYAYGDTQSVTFDQNGAGQGYIQIKYAGSLDKRIKVMIENTSIQSGKSKYYYDLKTSNKFERFPLQMGDGTYRITVLQNVKDNRYRVMDKSTLVVNIQDEMSVYLSSVQMVRWDENTRTARIAKLLTQKSESSLDKVKRIHKYITSNITYDYDKISSLSADYVPNVDKTLSSKTGICYDYASLFAAMLRSVGVPTKLVKGYGEKINGYHAWNEVYIEELDQWVLIDTTYDAQIKQTGSIFKEADQYTKVYEY